MKKLYKSESAPKHKDLQTVIDSALDVATDLGVIDDGHRYSEHGFMPDQDLDEVVVTAPKKEDFLDKYKFYIIGAILLLVILLKKK
jgi:hypothetical protein